MQITSIKHGLVTFRLTPDDCRCLAKACHTALEAIISPEEVALARYIETAGALFTASAAAGHAQWNMVPDSLKILDAELIALGLP